MLNRNSKHFCLVMKQHFECYLLHYLLTLYLYILLHCILILIHETDGPTASSPASEDVKEHGTVFVDCTAESNPDADSFKWKKEGDIHFVQDGHRF